MPASDQIILPDRYLLVPRVLCFITYEGREVLLLKGAPTKKIWANKYNGVGGHVERDEDFYSAAKREIIEETGLRVHSLRFRGAINIETAQPPIGSIGGQPAGIGMFVFTAVTDTKETTSSDEGTLEWVPFAEVPSRALVEDLPALIPKVLGMADDDPPFFGRYWYDVEGKLQIAFAP
jgi:8-oxo-dGTP diphosphatase